MAFWESDFVSWGWISRSRTAESYTRSLFPSVPIPPVASPISTPTNDAQRLLVPTSSPALALSFSAFVSDHSVLTGVRGHLILILICVALVIGAVGHFVFLLFLAAPWHMEFLGRGSDSSCSCDLCGSARAFNPRCRAGDGTCILVWQSRRWSCCTLAGPPVDPFS